MNGLAEGSSIVAVVGSKPDPVLPERIDTMVCCNGSVYLLDRPDISPNEVWHCITNWTLCEAHEAGALTREQLLGREVDFLIEFTTLPPEELDHTWESLGLSYERMTTVNNTEKGELTFSFFDARFYLDLIMAPCPIREKISVCWSVVRRKKKPGASTGILALLFAIRHANTGNQTFVLCGVGFDNDGYQFLRRPINRGHICIDYCVLRALSRSLARGKLLVSDKRLADLADLPLFEA